MGDNYFIIAVLINFLNFEVFDLYFEIGDRNFKFLFFYRSSIRYTLLFKLILFNIYKFLFIR